jgi:hypothetical protein
MAASYVRVDWDDVKIPDPDLGAIFTIPGRCWRQQFDTCARFTPPCD